MEIYKKWSNQKTAVNMNAKPAEGMQVNFPGEGLSTSYEDLGGPSPENYKPNNDSAKT